MPDSSPPTRSPDEQRFSIGVTSVCVASGTLQIPFAMRGIFEPGTYPVLDVDRNETTELVFEPPRSLRGLDEIFAAHELQPNDEVILTVTSSALELEVSKRPRRKVQQAKGEPWESVSGRHDGAKDAPSGSKRIAVDGGQAPLFAAGAPREEASRAIPDERLRAEDTEAPRIVRARRVAPGEERPRMHIPGALVGSGASSGAPERTEEPRAKHEVKPTDASAARRFFEDPGDPEDPYAPDALAGETWQFERPAAQPARRRPAEESSATSGGLFAKIAQAAKGAFAFRGGAAGEEAAGMDAQQGARPPEAGGSYSPRQEQPRQEQPRDQTRETPRESHEQRGMRDAGSSPRPVAPPSGPEPAHRPEPVQADEPSVRPATGREGRTEPFQRSAPQRQESPAASAPSSASQNVVVEDADAERMDQFGPAMWELGEGDLRSRLIRFLQHPDVPVILRTEIVARNFGLGAEVAEAMLEDLAHDKIDGLVITKVREQTYRISRAPTEL